MKYILYARKSSESEDRQLASLADQLNTLRKLALERNITIIREFTESKSAKAPGRPVFNEMIAYVEKNTVGIICWKLNRLFRNPKDEGTVRWMLENRNITDITTPLKTYVEADSDFIMAIEGSQASRFIRDLKVDTARGIKKKLEMGMAPLRAFPGYRNATEKLQGQRDIIPFEEQFPLWRRVFDLALTGKFTITQLYDQAKALNVTNNKNDATIARTTFFRILSDPYFYTGKFRYAGVEYQGSHQRLLSDDEYQLLRKLFSIEPMPRVENTSRSYNGLLKCSCGHWMTGDSHTKTYKNGKTQSFTYYRCVHCGNPTSSIISLPSLEEQAGRYLSKITIQQKYVDLFVDYIHERNTQDKELRESFFKSADRMYNETRQKLDNLFNAFLSTPNRDKSMISDDEYLRKHQELLIEKKKYDDQRRQVDQHIEDFSDVCIKTFLFARDAKKRFETGDISIKRTIMKALGSNLTVNGKELDITVRTPFETIGSHLVDSALIQPTIKSDMMRQRDTLYAQNPILGTVWDSMRTYYSDYPTDAIQYHALLNEMYGKEYLYAQMI